MSGPGCDLCIWRVDVDDYAHWRVSPKRLVRAFKVRGMHAHPGPLFGLFRVSTRARFPVFCGPVMIGFLCWPTICGAQMVGPTPQPPGVPVTSEQAEQVQLETWAVHGQSTISWLLQPAFRSPYQGSHSCPASALMRQKGRVEEGRISGPS